jgi:uncharacterized protein (DUF433 family)
MSERTTIFLEANIEGRTVTQRPPRSYRGSPKSRLSPVYWLGGVQGVELRNGPAGPRAVVSGTGLDVWEIIATWQRLGENFERLQESYHWLAAEQLESALEYYEQNTEEIEARLAREAEWTLEAVWERFPYARPRF